LRGTLKAEGTQQPVSMLCVGRPSRDGKKGYAHADRPKEALDPAPIPLGQAFPQGNTRRLAFGRLIHLHLRVLVNLKARWRQLSSPAAQSID
jgi:hypothetical protein